MEQGRILEFAKGGAVPPLLSPSLPFHFPSHFLSSSPPLPLEAGPLKPGRGLESAVSSSIGVQGGAPSENEFGAL